MTAEAALIGIIAIFVLSWSISTLIYRRKGYDDLPVAPRSWIYRQIDSLVTFANAR